MRDRHRADDGGRGAAHPAVRAVHPVRSSSSGVGVAARARDDRPVPLVRAALVMVRARPNRRGHYRGIETAERDHMSGRESKFGPSSLSEDRPFAKNSSLEDGQISEAAARTRRRGSASPHHSPSGTYVLTTEGYGSPMSETWKSTAHPADREPDRHRQPDQIDPVNGTRARGNDTFRALIDPHRDELYAYCRRILGTRHDAEDAYPGRDAARLASATGTARLRTTTTLAIRHCEQHQPRHDETTINARSCRRLRDRR